MAKKRTKKQKERASLKRLGTGSFKIEFGAIEGAKRPVSGGKKESSERKYFRSDLTKVFLLTMLALALEIALWFYLTR